MEELVKFVELREQLDEIDRTIYDDVYDGYLNSRLRILMGMWEKGEVLSLFRGVKGETSYNQLEKETGRKGENLKKWYELYKNNPNKNLYIENKAKPQALKWTQKVLSEKGNVNNVHVGNNSGENEWYTPEYIIDAAIKTMGSIDLDPATSLKANEIVKAKQIFTKEDNGLIQKWYGNVWLNPPYAQPLINEFSAKIIDELPNINRICILVNNATETNWFQNLLSVCDCICLLKGRIKFIDINGNATGAPLQGQAVIYFGSNRKEFYSNFCDIGVCLTRTEGK